MGGGGDLSGTWGRIWSSDASLWRHFYDHVGNTGARSPEHYRRMARYVARSNERVIMQYARSDGRVVRYNPRTNEFVVVGGNGRIETYFRPTDGIRYYTRDRERIR